MQKTLKRYIGDALTPAARAWIRYAPLRAGKPWLWQTFHWRPHAFTCRTQGGNRICGTTEDLIQRHLYFFGTWEPHISHWLAATLRPGDCFVDIGANIGHYSLLASRLVGANGRVVAIEAAQWIHALLDRHVALNHRRNIRTVQVAAAAERGTVKLYPGNAGNIGKTSMVAAHDAAPVDVPALPLTEILSTEEIAQLRVIKIDVEGAELDVLRGLAPLLPRLPHEAEIVMEVAPQRMPGAVDASDEIFATFAEYGFRAYAFDNDYDDVEPYLEPGQHKRPVAITDCRLTSQADVLFSRSAY
jgi:FkbM family methyltransferase